MNFSESFKQAVDSLRANKLRSILTMIGIVMGVFSVITIMAIGNATKSYVNSQFDKYGANVVTIQYRTNNSASMTENEWLTLEDIDFIKKVAPEIKNIATDTQVYGTLRIGAKTRSAVVMGVTSQYKHLNPLEMLEGRFVNDIDVKTQSNVVVVDEYFARRYFKRTDIVGEIISFRTSSGSSLNLRIIGVLKVEDSIFSGLLDNDYVPATVFSPITSVQTSLLFSSKRLEKIDITIIDNNKVKEVSNRIVKALEAKKGTKERYMAIATTQMMQSISQNVIGVISAVLLVIAVITLVVGGIGIVNILLVSVTERIREIGTRKALGARKSDIVMQFITESIVMTGISGLAGIVLGILIGGIISAQIKIPPIVDLKVIILAFLGSIALGLIFGVYPAKKAADLDPIEALRYE